MRMAVESSGVSNALPDLMGYHTLIFPERDLLRYTDESKITHIERQNHCYSLDACNDNQ